MKKALFFLVVAATLVFAGCVTPYYEGHFATSNAIVKVGEAPVGDDVNSVTGIQLAAKNGGITKIATVDIYRHPDGDKYIVSGE